MHMTSAIIIPIFIKSSTEELDASVLAPAVGGTLCGARESETVSLSVERVPALVPAVLGPPACCRRRITAAARTGADDDIDDGADDGAGGTWSLTPAARDCAARSAASPSTAHLTGSGAGTSSGVGVA